jgi:hypothetical protein
MKWRTMESAPKDGRPILAICDHEADDYYLDDGKTLTIYGAHCERGVGRVPDGPNFVRWGGEIIEYGFDDVPFTIPNWWFRVESDFESNLKPDFEEVANPILWCPIPEMKETE